MALDLESVHQQMLDNIDDKYQKTVGFPAYDFTRAFALAVLSLDGDITVAESKLNLENLTGAELDEYIKQHRGLTRKYATYATATLRIVTGAGTISAGDLFSTASGVQFYAISDGTYEQGDTFVVRAYVGGTSGNVGPNTITYMPVTIAGIAEVTNDEAATGGFDAESDEEFRERYYDDLQNPNNGSNQQAYIAWAMSVAGVGKVRIFPQAFGQNTVEVCIVDPNAEPATEAVIGQVQELIDPNENGDGSGEAPIGAVCTVTTATELAVNVSATMVVEDSTSVEAVKPAVEEAITKYLREIAFEKGTTYVSFTQVAGRINGVEGVIDHSDLLLNGVGNNVALGERQTPVLGEVTLT